MKMMMMVRRKRGGDDDENFEETMIGEKSRGSGSGSGAPARSNTVRTGAAAAAEGSPSARSSTSDATTTIGTIEAADQDVREQFHCLMVAIKGHAELYYTTRPVEEEDQIKYCDENLPTIHDVLGPDAPVDALTMDALLRASDTRHDAIRLLLAWVILRYIQPDAPLSKTLLPAELCRCAQAMARPAGREPEGDDDEARRKSGGTALQASASASQEHVRQTGEDDRVAFAKWRETSGRLFQPIFGDGSVGVYDSREANIGELVTVLVCLLQPYVAKGYGGARVRDLENVVKAGAAFGYKLFTQRTEWEFAWSTLMADEIVVYPALVKIGDDKGHKLRQSIVLSWEETVKLNEPLDSVSRRASGLPDLGAA
jgi:hypothetical protein